MLASHKNNSGSQKKDFVREEYGIDVKIIRNLEKYSERRKQRRLGSRNQR